MKLKKKLILFISTLFKTAPVHSTNYYNLSKLNEYEEKDVYSYINLINDISSKKIKKTNSNIYLLSGKKNRAITTRDVRNYYGKPNQVIRNKQDSFDITIYVYRIYLGNYRARFKLHFNNGKLVLYTYGFSSLKDEEKKEIINTLSKKYLKQENLDINNEYILDAKNTMITFSQQTNFSINYIFNTSFISKINETIKKGEKTKKSLIKKKESELYRRL